MLRVANVLTPVDPAKPNPALRHALLWAQAYGATLHAVQVYSSEGDMLPSPTPRPSEAVRRTVMDARDADLAAASQTLTLEAFTMEAPSPTEGLLRYAADHTVDLIITAPPETDISRPILSMHSLSEIVQRATCPMLIVNASPDSSARYRRLLAPVDFSRHAQRGLGHAKSLAALYDAALDVLHVLERPPYVALNPTDMLALSDAKLPERKALRRAQSLFDGAPGPAVPAQFYVAHGDPAEQIMAFVEAHDNDLVVLSSHGSTGQSQHPLGTVASKTMRHLAMPVFLVPSFGGSLLLPDTPSSPPFTINNAH